MIVRTLRALGDHQHVRDLHADTLNRRRHILGDNHPDTLRSANNLANSLHRLGEHERAEEPRRWVAGRREAEPGQAPG